MKHTPLKFAFALLGAAAITTAITSAAIYTDGHADFGVAYEGGGTFDFHFHAEGGTVDGIERDDEEFPISSVITLATEESLITIPSGYDASFIGLGDGDSLWVLPEVQQTGLPFLGLATEELTAGEWGTIVFSLGTVTSPSGSGNFALWQSGSFGETLLAFSTADPGVDAISTITGSHSHYNWGFTEPGIWQIEMTVSGTHIDDGFVTSTEILTFNVIPEPSTALLSAIGALSLLRRRRLK